MKTLVAGALGECVHVAGVSNFLRLAEQAGWRTVFLGPAVSVEDFIAAVKREQADLVGVSYRLTPETGERLLGEFSEAADELRSAGVRFAFGGTPPVASRANASGFFEQVFDGSQTAAEVLQFLKGEKSQDESLKTFPQTTTERIAWKSPYPLLRHHFGLPTLEATLSGVQEIAESRLIDVISLGIDQDAQENFFHPERQNPRRRGAGGVPVRSPEDYRALYQASRTGSYPLLRTYSGTDDFIRLAEMYIDTIQNAWCAIPLFWFNRMDGRGPWDLAGSIGEHQQVMAWYGERGIPVELNEPHHWGMRDAPDVIFVVSAYLAAYNARAFGVKDYIAQLMFNSPPGLSDAHGPGENDGRAGFDRAVKPGRISASGARRAPVCSAIRSNRRRPARTWLPAFTCRWRLSPHIIHIVGHTEADHAATGEDVIEAARMARRVIENALSHASGQPDLTADPVIQQRKQQLIKEAGVTLEAIRGLGAKPFIRSLDRSRSSGSISCPGHSGCPTIKK